MQAYGPPSRQLRRTQTRLTALRASRVIESRVMDRVKGRLRVGLALPLALMTACGSASKLRPDAATDARAGRRRSRRRRCRRRRRRNGRNERNRRTRGRGGSRRRTGSRGNRRDRGSDRRDRWSCGSGRGRGQRCGRGRRCGLGRRRRRCAIHRSECRLRALRDALVQRGHIAGRVSNHGRHHRGDARRREPDQPNGTDAEKLRSAAAPDRHRLRRYVAGCRRRRVRDGSHHRSRIERG